MYRRREIAIDLTALLDVILIILFMFVVRSTNQVEAVNTKDTSESIRVEKLKEENQSLKDRITSNSILDDTCLMITIIVDSTDDSSDSNSDKNLDNDLDRTIRIIFNKASDDKKKSEDEKEYADKEVKYNWDKLTFAKNKLEDTLSEICNQVKDTNQMILYIFQYDKGKIYNKDYKVVDSVLKKMQEDKDNVYLAYYDTSKEEIVKEDKNE